MQNADSRIVTPAHLCKNIPLGSEPGTKYGRLTVVEFVGRSPNQKPLVLARCECGKIAVKLLPALKNGYTRSCGCMIGESAKSRFTTHGATRTKTYMIWSAMHSRCGNPANKDFHHYGGRGITVGERWTRFENFLEDMGEKPSGMTLDREDNNKNYEPGNARWVSWTQQQRNKRNNRWLLVDGVRLIYQDAAEKIGVHQSSLWIKVKRKSRDGVVVFEYHGRLVEIL